MITPADELIVLKAAWFIYRRGVHTSLTPDDLKQQARLVLLISNIPDDPVHRARYVFKRAAGAMQDANRAAFGDMPGTVDELSDDARSSNCSTERVAQWTQAISRIDRKATPRCLQVPELMADGLSAREVAEELHISQSRVSVLRRDARRIIEACV